MTIVWISCAIATMGIYNIVPLFLVKERGIQIELANTLFSISRVGGFIAMILIGFIIDKFNLKPGVKESVEKTMRSNPIFLEKFSKYQINYKLQKEKLLEIGKKRKMKIVDAF